MREGENGALTAQAEQANALRAEHDALAQSWEEEAGKWEREEASCQRQAQVDECAGHRGELVRQAAELKRLLLAHFPALPPCRIRTHSSGFVSYVLW